MARLKLSSTRVPCNQWNKSIFCYRRPEFPFRLVKGESFVLFSVWNPAEQIYIFWAHFEHSITFLRSFIHQTFSTRYHLPFIECLSHAGRSLSALSHLLVSSSLLLSNPCSPLTPKNKAYTSAFNTCSLTSLQLYTTLSGKLSLVH